MTFHEKRVLGRTGILVGRLGVASSYGAPAQAFEEAFERGCNYFWWGWKRDRGMREALKNIIGRGDGDRLFISIQSYSRSSLYLERSLRKALRLIGRDRAEALILGRHNWPVSRRLLDKAEDLKARGLIRFVGMSGHNRPLFPKLGTQGRFDLFHIRYNAAHRGAEEDAFPALQTENRPGVVTYTATHWGRLLDPRRAPDGQPPASASDCYRFVMSNPLVDVCMCGPKNRAQMSEALTALDLGPMPEDDLARMRRLGDHVRGQGRFL